MPGFSLKNCCPADKEKRSNPYGGSTSEEPPAKKQFKPPAAGSLVMMESVPRMARPQRLPAVAPFVVCIYKAGRLPIRPHSCAGSGCGPPATQVTDHAADLWNNYEGTEAKLFQIQMEHQARPSALFNVRDSFNDFLKENARSNAGMPDTVQKLQAEAGIKLIMTNQDDPDSIGCFVQYRLSV